MFPTVARMVGASERTLRQICFEAAGRRFTFNGSLQDIRSDAGMGIAIIRKTLPRTSSSIARRSAAVAVPRLGDLPSVARNIHTVSVSEFKLRLMNFLRADTMRAAALDVATVQLARIDVGSPVIA